MATPRILGGNNREQGLLSGPNDSTGQGVYASFPAGTPKYHGGNTTESVYAQARLYVTLGDRATYQRFRQVVPDRAKRLLDILATESSARSIGFFDFILESISSTRQEKMQVNEVLSDGFVAYFFGERAPMWSLSGSLLNTQQDEWYNAWHVLYDDLLRGSKSAQYRVPIRLAYNDREVIGYFTTSSEMLTSQRETAASFQVQMLVKRINIRQTYNPNNPSKGLSRANNTVTEETQSQQQTVSTFMSSQEASTRLATDELNRVLPTQSLVEQFATGSFTTLVRPGANISDVEGLTGATVNPAPTIFGTNL